MEDHVTPVGLSTFFLPSLSWPFESPPCTFDQLVPLSSADQFQLGV